MNELIPITITIADRNFRIKVEAKDEETVRKTVKFINEKIAEFKLNFGGKDMQDYISMVLVWFATQPTEAMAQQVQNTATQEGLERLESILDKALS